MLVEKEPSIGGHMSQLSETFPTLDCSQCILTPRMVEVAQHPQHHAATPTARSTPSRATSATSRSRIRQKARERRRDEVQRLRRLPAGVPVKKIPERVRRRARASARRSTCPFPQAVPNIPVIDREHCALLQGQGARHAKDACGKCTEACPRGAIDFDQEDQLRHREGRRHRRRHRLRALLHREGAAPPASRATASTATGRSPTSSTACSSSGWPRPPGRPAAKILRPSDGKEPKRIVFLQCVGSRDPAKGIAYCSKICCMYIAKHTMLYQHKVHDGEAYVFYMDIRAAGQELRRVRAPRDRGGRRRLHPRPRLADLPARATVIRSSGVDTLAGEPGGDRRRHGRPGHGDAARRRGSRRSPRSSRVSYDQYGFFTEAHPKLRPVETNTAGIFVAGACQAPERHPRVGRQASAAAAKVLGLFSQRELEREPTVARVDAALCVGCFHCERVCPYGAVEQKEIRDRKGEPRSRSSPTSTPASARAAAPARPPARRRAWSCRASPTSRSTPR